MSEDLDLADLLAGAPAELELRLRIAGPAGAAPFARAYADGRPLRLGRARAIFETLEVATTVGEAGVELRVTMRIEPGETE